MDTSLENNIKYICQNNYHYMLNLQNVNGVGLGFKYINGINTGEPCIHVLVNKKLEKSQIISGNLVPSSYMGIKTDVIEVKIPTARALTSKVRPLRGGYSISYPNSQSAGTLGCIVYWKNWFTGNKTFYALTNSHVLPGLNSGDLVMQPSEVDGGNVKKDIIGTFKNSVYIYYKTRFGGYVENYVDAAIVEITNSKIFLSKVDLIGQITGTAEPKLGSFVKKTGRTTGLTKGTITSLHVTTNILLDRGEALFKDLIYCNLKNWFGDSGSILVNKNNKVVGLFFAGEGDNIAIASPISHVLSALNVELLVNNYKIVDKPIYDDSPFIIR